MEALVGPGGDPGDQHVGHPHLGDRGGLALPGRVVGAHWWTPAYLMPIVEIIPGEKTTQETVDRVTRLMAEAGKLPVYVKKDAPGFVGNRLLHCLYREAMHIVERGHRRPGRPSIWCSSTGRARASR